MKLEVTDAAGWLQERLENLYKKDPGYSDKAASLFTLDLQSPQELPDNLRGEQWNFVQLPLSALVEELDQVKQVTLFMLGQCSDSTMAVSCQKHSFVSVSSFGPNRLMRRHDAKLHTGCVSCLCGKACLPASSHTSFICVRSGRVID